MPHLDQIIYKLVKDKTARRIGLQRNEFQLADASGVMRLTDIDEFKKIEHLALTEMKSVSGSSIVLEFNNREGPLADKAVRQAIAYGIDRAYISNVLHAGYTKPSQGPLPFTTSSTTPTSRAIRTTSTRPTRCSTRRAIPRATTGSASSSG